LFRAAFFFEAHMTPDQAAESVLDTFKRVVRQELELLDLECSDQPPHAPH